MYTVQVIIQCPSSLRRSCVCLGMEGRSLYGDLNRVVAPTNPRVIERFQSPYFTGEEGGWAWRRIFSR
jgi:hypothetical protein